jgi:hypothetical protein
MARLAFEWDSPSWRRGFVYLQPVASSVNILLHEITVWFGVKCDNSLFFKHNTTDTHKHAYELSLLLTYTHTIFKL